MRATFTLLVLFFSSSLTSQNCEPSAFEVLDVGNVSAGMLNGGDLFWDLSDARYEVPKGSGKHSVFSGAIWLSGINADGELANAAMTYRQSGFDYGPGPLCSEGLVYETGCNDFNRIWKVNQTDIDAQLAALNNGSTEASELPPAIINWPGKNNPHFDLFELPSDKSLAPFIDTNDDGIYDPLAGDYPRINGDQGLWWVFNDLAVPHTETSGTAMGLEISILAYAFSQESGNGLANHTFYEINIYNPIGEFSDFYFSKMIDVDLGTFDDDFIGCNPESDLAFSYNGDDNDQGVLGYGTDIPIIGASLLKGLTASDGNQIGMTIFNTFNNDFTDNGNPTEASEYTNLIIGQNVAGTPTSDPDGNPTNYIYPDNPSDPEGWSECTQSNLPADRRMLMSSGPIDFSAGERQTVHFAILWTKDADYPCPDISPLLQENENAKLLLDEVLNNSEALSYQGGSCLETASGINDLNTELTVYPNPIVEHQFSTSLQSEFDGPITLKLFDAKGAQILSQAYQPQQTIYLNKNIAEGVYFIELQSNKQVLQSAKVLVL